MYLSCLIYLYCSLIRFIKYIYYGRVLHYEFTPDELLNKSF